MHSHYWSSGDYKNIDQWFLQWGRFPPQQAEHVVPPKNKCLLQINVYILNDLHYVLIFCYKNTYQYILKMYIKMNNDTMEREVSFNILGSHWLPSFQGRHTDKCITLCYVIEVTWWTTSYPLLSKVISTYLLKVRD